MSSNEIRSKFLKFFESKQHLIIPSASLVTPDEKGITNSTLFNTAGMQPLVPYLLGKPYLKDGKQYTRLANSQKCLRTVDIDDVGDNTHATFFEMLGNWSLGDYFKQDAIKWSYEFLTDNKIGLGLDPQKLYVTVFEGDENAPKDNEAYAIWQEIFKNNNVQGERIFFMGADKNWWQAGENGPCGPDSEMYYDVKNKFEGKGITKQEFITADDERSVVEVWNDVFMQFEKKNGKIIGNLPKPSVDTGAGLERLAMVIQGVDNIYDTDLLKPVMEKIKEFSKKVDFNEEELKSARIIADHLRASIFLISDGVVPEKDLNGYVLRRLIRSAIRQQRILHLEVTNINVLIPYFVDIYKDMYPEIKNEQTIVERVLGEEGGRFLKTIHSGDEKLLQIFNRAKNEKVVISGKSLFDIYSTYGFPIEESIKQLDILNRSSNLEVNLYNREQIIPDFKSEMIKHQALSRAGAEQKFKGGLADVNDEMVVRYHTATHLLHQALFDVLGQNVMQKGSNITGERLRFDFAHGAKMTDEEKKKVEDIVNEKIRAKLPVNKVVLPLAEAEKTGAKHFFGEKYGNEVSIYFIGNDMETAFSKEFCGGPHVGNTYDLSGPNHDLKFKIKKEEAVAQGIRRIKAVLEK
jgi:alanyl-tRNA synthetase